MAPETKKLLALLNEGLLKAVQINLKYEKNTVDFYRKVLNLIPSDRPILYEAIEHVLEDSEEHVEELERLVSK